MTASLLTGRQPMRISPAERSPVWLRAGGWSVSPAAFIASFTQFPTYCPLTAKPSCGLSRIEGRVWPFRTKLLLPSWVSRMPIRPKSSSRFPRRARLRRRRPAQIAIHRAKLRERRYNRTRGTTGYIRPANRFRPCAERQSSFRPRRNRPSTARGLHHGNRKSAAYQPFEETAWRVSGSTKPFTVLRARLASTSFGSAVGSHSSRYAAYSNERSTPALLEATI